MELPADFLSLGRGSVIVSVSRYYAGPFSDIGRPSGPEYGLRQRTGPIDRGIKNSGACLRHHTTG